MSGESRRFAAMTAARAVWGGTLIAAPGVLCRAVAKRPATAHEDRVVRFLGARHLAQAALTAARPTPATSRLSTGLDVLHATTCLAAAVWLPAWRRLAAAGAAEALTFALAGYSTGQRALSAGS